MLPKWLVIGSTCQVLIELLVGGLRRWQEDRLDPAHVRDQGPACQNENDRHHTDGGAIAFKNYDNGVVSLSLQGSCSGCPSSMITLKSGIEGMMKRMIPEVKEVVAVAD